MKVTQVEEWSAVTCVLSVLKADSASKWFLWLCGSIVKSKECVSRHICMCWWSDVTWFCQVSLYELACGMKELWETIIFDHVDIADAYILMLTVFL